MTSLYIYYNVCPDQSLALQAAVQAMHATLRARMPGLAAGLWVRGEPSPPITWMETYHFNGHADERAWRTLHEALDALVATLPPGTEGPRHHEHFTLVRPAGFAAAGESSCA